MGIIITKKYRSQNLTKSFQGPVGCCTIVEASERVWKIAQKAKVRLKLRKNFKIRWLGKSIIFRIIFESFQR